MPFMNITILNNKECGAKNPNPSQTPPKSPPNPNPVHPTFPTTRSNPTNSAQTSACNSGCHRNPTSSRNLASIGA